MSVIHTVIFLIFKFLKFYSSCWWWNDRM